MDLKHSKKMVSFIATNPDCFDESEEWSQRITNNKENLHSLTTLIHELDEINRSENAEVLSVIAAINDVKVRVIDARGRFGQIHNLFNVHNRTTKRPQTISPSSIVGELQEEDDNGCFKSCALCGR